MIINQINFNKMTNLITSTKARFLKSCLIFMLPAVIFCGCESRNTEEKDTGFVINGSYLKIYIIDSCEYIGVVDGGDTDKLTHKGNCKFCAERSKK